MKIQHLIHTGEINLIILIFIGLLSDPVSANIVVVKNKTKSIQKRKKHQYYLRFFKEK